MIIRAFVCLCFAWLFSSAAVSQAAGDPERVAAYQLFHQGKTRHAATKLKEIAASLNIRDRVVLQRDILEVCAEGYDWPCVHDTIQQMLAGIRSEPKLSIIYPDIILYEAKRAQWFEDDAYFARFVETGGPSQVATPIPHAALHSEIALVVHRYLLEQGRTRSAEDLRSSAILGLLLAEPQNTYAISKALVALIESLVDAQDIVGAYALASEVDSFLVKSIAQTGPLYARYRLLLGQLLAFTNAHGLTVATLADAARLYEQLEIDESVKLHRTAVANSLASAALVMDGKLGEAQALHAKHPLQPIREALFKRGEFETSTEFFFGVSDIFLRAVVAKERPDGRWAPLFEKEPAWKLAELERMSFDSYRGFAFGLIRIAEGDRRTGVELLFKAAHQRLSIFEKFQQGSAENFHLPSLVDKILIVAGLTSALEKGDAESVDLIIRGSELLGRNLRHHLVDTAGLLASQPNPESRRRVHAFVHLLAKKREWEQEKIRKLVSNDGIVELRGAVLEHYTKAVGKIAVLKGKISSSGSLQGGAGLRPFERLQKSLGSKQVYVGYFPHLGGIGKICISSQSWKIAATAYDPSILEDVKTVGAAVAQFPRNDVEARRFPSSAAVRIYEFLFGGLDECVQPGSHITVALPPEFASVPLSALLRLDRRLPNGEFDLQNAKWFIKDFSFSIVLSAGHHLATASGQSRLAVNRTFLGIGDPVFDGGHQEKLAATKLFRASLKTPHGILDFTPLPETSEEVRAAGSLFAAAKEDMLLRENGTEEAFRARPLGDYDIIHFATHGLVSADLAGLSDSALVLTPGSSSDSYDDGLLSATEISRLSLNARLVILSACNTAKYDVAQATRSVQDLQAAFTVAGAPTLLASLWPVDSLTTKDLITAFLRDWRAVNSSGAADALARTIRSYIAKVDGLHQHPSYWAPFVIVGNGGVVGAQSINASQREPAFELLKEFSSGGEIFHVAEIGGDALVSMIAEWDGVRMNGITSRRILGSSEKWRLASREVGTGRVAVHSGQIYAAGYVVSRDPIPVLRGVSLDGRLKWKSEYPDLKGYMFSDIVANRAGARVVAYPHLVPEDGNQEVFVLSISKEGNVQAKTKIGVRRQGINIGTVALIAQWGDRLAVVVNSGLSSKLKFDRKTRAGLPTICWEGASSIIYDLDLKHRLLSTREVQNFRTNSVVQLDGALLLGGDLLDGCWIQGTAALVRVDPSGEPQRIWSDDDIFTSSGRGIARVGGQLFFAIGHERTLGIPPDKQKPEQDYSQKRWSEDVATAREASVVILSHTGDVIDRRYISGGLGVYLGGVAEVEGRTIAYGSMGGVPGFATLSRRVEVKKRPLGVVRTPAANGNWQIEMFSNR